MKNMRVYLQSTDSLDGLLEVVERRPTIEKFIAPQRKYTNTQPTVNEKREGNLIRDLAFVLYLLINPQPLPLKIDNQRSKDGVRTIEPIYMNTLEYTPTKISAYDLMPASIAVAADIETMSEAESITLPKGDYSLREIMREAQEQFGISEFQHPATTIVINNYSLKPGKEFVDDSEIMLSGEVRLTRLRRDGETRIAYRLKAKLFSEY